MTLEVVFITLSVAAISFNVTDTIKPCILLPASLPLHHSASLGTQHYQWA